MATPLDASLARQSATSAWRSSVPTSCPCVGHSLTPMLAETQTCCLNRSNGSASRSRSLPATSTPSSALNAGNTTANSSPPRRATRSLSRMYSRSRFATPRSRASPASCPSVSLITLKRSRSIIKSDTLPPSRLRSLINSSSCSRSSARFGSFVSSSCRARWRISPSSSLRSVTSRITSTVPGDSEPGPSPDMTISRKRSPPDWSGTVVSKLRRHAIASSQSAGTSWSAKVSRPPRRRPRSVVSPAPNIFAAD